MVGDSSLDFDASMNGRLVVFPVMNVHAKAVLGFAIAMLDVVAIHSINQGTAHS